MGEWWCARLAPGAVAPAAVGWLGGQAPEEWTRSADVEGWHAMCVSGSAGFVADPLAGDGGAGVFLHLVAADELGWSIAGVVDGVVVGELPGLDMPGAAEALAAVGIDLVELAEAVCAAVAGAGVVLGSGAVDELVEAAEDADLDGALRMLGVPDDLIAILG